MKIKVKSKPYAEVLRLPAEKHLRPKRPSLLFRTLMRVLSVSELRGTKFTYDTVGMERLGKREPCLILMNHSCFLDLKIASAILYPRPYNIVCTSDGFVGKKWLMRNLGCIPTKKFVTELSLVRDMMYALKTLKTSVLMYPEASYSFDGTATPLPETLGKCIRMLGVPVIMIRTEGAFSHNPLYNELKLRRVKVRATVKYLLSPEEIQAMSPNEINEIVGKEFAFDNFRWQKDNHMHLTEKYRADSLNRVLYKCTHCLSEGATRGEGTTLTCTACGKRYVLDEEGFMRAAGKGHAEIAHIPDWYAWERACVKEEILAGTYRLDIPVRIGMMVNTKAIYMVGEGRLVHDLHGFQLTGCDGKLSYTQSPLASYSLYADYYWYEIGDMICIGNHDVLYYCFPTEPCDVVAKTRLAAEELYKLARAAVRKAPAVASSEGAAAPPAPGKDGAASES